jgi:hypothetical protein
MSNWCQAKESIRRVLILDLKVDQSGNKYFSSDRGNIIPTDKKGIRLDAKSNLYSTEKSSFNDRSFFGIYKLIKTAHFQNWCRISLMRSTSATQAMMESQNMLFLLCFRDVNKIKGSKRVFP